MLAERLGPNHENDQGKAKDRVHDYEHDSHLERNHNAFIMLSRHICDGIEFSSYLC